MKILMTTQRPLKVIHYTLFELGAEQNVFESELQIGTHEMVRASWTTKDGRNITCLWLKGTRIGCAEGSLRQWQGSEWGDFEITFEELDEDEALPPTGLLAPI
jgi:hypothetical protein